MRAAILILSLLSSGASAQPSDPYQAVLERRKLDVIALRGLGYILNPARHLDANGAPEGPTLTPEQLEERLAALERGKPVLPPPPPPHLPPVLPVIDTAALGQLYDGASADALPVLPVATPPSFNESWAKIEKDFLSPKTRNAAVKSLKARFQKDPASLTGLTADAPDALRLLAREIHEGRGNDAAAVELKRQLTVAANITNPQKFEFAAKITSPVTVFVALARSRSTHSLDSRLYFARMINLLDAEGRTLSGFLLAQDPQSKRSADFLLRAHSYDALVPHLELRPTQASAIAPLLLPRSGDIKSRADALEGLLLQLCLRGRAGGAGALFTQALIDHALTAPPELASRIAVFLKLNEAVIPKSMRASLKVLEPLIPDGVLEDAGLIPPHPRETWPTDRWQFNVHFASTESYAGWRSRFLARGYVPALVDGEPALAKRFAGIEVLLVAFVYEGDDDDFLRGAEATRFLNAVTKDLRSPFVQGVILRTHAQFRISNLFDKKVVPGKLFLDGACRSAWDLRELRRRCPSCQFIVNTGTGRGKLNNDTVLAVVEGLANDLEWDEIGAEFRRTSPSTSARIQGPWTPPFAEALRVLERREQADLRAAKSPLTN